MKICDDKEFVRLIEFTAKFFNDALPHERYKNIINNTYPALSKEELNVKRLANAYLYVLNNTKQPFSNVLINDAYYLLTKKRLSFRKIDNILSTYYFNSNENIYLLITLIHSLIIKEIKVRKYEFAFLISNYILIKNQKQLIIPRLCFKQKYKLAVKNNSTDGFVSLFSTMDNKIRVSKAKKIITQEIIKDTLILYKRKLVDDFSINAIFLYGSYAKNNMNYQSDIDLLVIFNVENNLHEKNSKKILLSNYLEKLFSKTVEVIDFEYAIKKLDISEMENIIRII